MQRGDGSKIEQIWEFSHFCPDGILTHLNYNLFGKIIAKQAWGKQGKISQVENYIVCMLQKLCSGLEATVEKNNCADTANVMHLQAGDL